MGKSMCLRNTLAIQRTGIAFVSTEQILRRNPGLGDGIGGRGIQPLRAVDGMSGYGHITGHQNSRIGQQVIPYRYPFILPVSKAGVGQETCGDNQQVRPQWWPFSKQTAAIVRGRVPVFRFRTACETRCRCVLQFSPGKTFAVDIGHSFQQPFLAMNQTDLQTAMTECQCGVDTDKSAADHHRMLHPLLFYIAVDGLHVGEGFETEYPPHRAIPDWKKTRLPAAKSSRS
jgi:hypothetical protein